MKLRKSILAFSTLALILTACGNSKDKKESTISMEDKKMESKIEANRSDISKENSSKDMVSNKDSNMVTIKDIHGEVEVKKNPSKVVSLDNRTFETLDQWGISLKAVPKDVMPKDLSYVKDENVENIGNHREPNLEILTATDPELVIVGQRFAKYYDEIKTLLPKATVIDFSYDVSGKNGNPGDNLINCFKESTLNLGKIFDKENEANSLIENFDMSIKKVKDTYKDSTIMGLVISGGDIGFSAPHSGRVWGPLFDIFNFKPALEVEDSSSDHKGDDVSVEAIAESNPDYLLVLDRDAAIADTESKSAKDIIENSQALAQTKAVIDKNIVYAPNDTYTNESIQTYIKIFNSLAESFKK